MDSLDAIAGDLRALRRDYDDLSLRLRIETPYQRLREHVSHAVSVLQRIPVAARWALLASILSLTYAVLYRNARAAALGVDLLFVAVVLV